MGEEITLEMAAKFIVIFKESSIKAVYRGMKTSNQMMASGGQQSFKFG